jgi:hypothetical protein
MKTNRILAGISTVLVAAFLLLAQSVTFAQRGGGGSTSCVNPPLTWEFDNGSYLDAQNHTVTYKITGEGGPYNGTSFFCGGKPDAHMNLQKTKRRVNFDFSGLVDLNPDGSPSVDRREPWMPSVPQPLQEVSLNIRSLGSVRDPGVPTRTVMAGTFKGPDSKSYLVRMTPLNDPLYVDIVLDNPPDSPPDVNTPWMTSHVIAVFYAPFTCPPSSACNNTYGMWEVFGQHQPEASATVVPPPQITTIYKSLGNLPRVGQFSLPFKVTVTALSPLPPVQ